MESPSISARVDNGSATALPDGYVRIAAGGRTGVACAWAAATVQDLLHRGTLRAWAAAQPTHERLHGRGVAYGVTLPAGPTAAGATSVVVRRNRHGGFLRALTGQLFLKPTRGPRELATALRLAAAGIPTPELVAYAVYPVAGLLARSDVMTRRLPEGADRPSAWRNSDAAARESILRAVAALLRSLARANARHPDLNLKNIYLAGRAPAITAYALDVDRVSFEANGDAAGCNFRRLARSARKWRHRWGLDFQEDTLARLAELAGEKA